ncbi:hypothetical protein G9I05_004353 [Salmonella enterica]|nr:hypothetical protein [Salmonella enterica]EEN5590618.1 hypothetical protein [Salmonella enterica subsp. enterica serovar Mountpleasant]EIO8738883.1 hypothetical protein [Salmonella enterica]
MATREIKLTRDWWQLTSGATTEIIQFRGSIEVADSAIKPDPDAPALHFVDDTLTATPPRVIWIRAADGNEGMTMKIL